MGGEEEGDRMPQIFASHRCPPCWILFALCLAASSLRAQTPAPGWPSLEGGGSYLLFLENSVILGNGTASESARGKTLRATSQERLFWFERGGREYVIRDAATLTQIKDLFEIRQKLGEQQAAVGAKQAAQRAKQAEIGTKMAKVAAQQAHLAGLGENSAVLEAQMQELESEQQNLAKPQEALRRQQEELGRQQEELAREAGKLLTALTGQAVASGLAQPVK
jgi:hypothetical protein